MKTLVLDMPKGHFGENVQQLEQQRLPVMVDVFHVDPIILLERTE